MSVRAPTVVSPPPAGPASDGVGEYPSRAGMLLQRSLSLPRTFGLTTAKYGGLLRRYREILATHGIRATFPTTAVALRRHPEILRRLTDDGDEVAVHGLTHMDHSRRDVETQTEMMRRARGIFRRLGFSPDGFRCPYLWWNEATPVAARRAGFSYISNQVFLWGEFDRRSIRRLYHVDVRPPASSLPFTRDGIIEIPVSLPDDFLLAVRRRLPPEEIAAVWSGMFTDIIRKGEMLVLELHPELLPRCAMALIALLAHAREVGGIWTPTMAEVARWWRARQTFDAVVAPRDGRLEVTVRAPPGAVVEFRADRHDEGGSTGSEWQTTPNGLLDLPGDRIPFVALPRTARDREVLAIRERGFVCRRADDPERYSARLTSEELRTLPIETWVARIEAGTGPLLRLRPWPWGTRAALCVTGDVDCLTLWDYAWRLVKR